MRSKSQGSLGIIVDFIEKRKKKNLEGVENTPMWIRVESLSLSTSSNISALSVT